MSTDTLYYDVLENKYSRDGIYKSMGGSQGDLFNKYLIEQLVQTVVAATYGENKQEAVACAALEALKGINPGNEIEGMMAAQLIATHHVSMFCFKRAQSESANIENSRLWINQGTKLSRSFYSLAQALKQDRAKQQAPIGLEQVEPPLQQTTRAKVRHQHAGHHDEHQGGAARQVEEPERELFCGEKTRHVPEHSTPETAPASAGFPNADSQDEPAGAEELAHVRNKQEPGPDCPAERSLGAAAESGKKLERPAGLPGLSSAAERRKPGNVVTEDEDEGNQVRPGPQDEANSSMPSENPEREPLPIAAHPRENSR